MHRVVVVAALALCACNLKRIAMRSLADTVSEPGGVYSRDDDPELVRDALPVMLKIMEQLADGLPDHKGVHLALCRSFTSYGVAFVQEDADRLHETNVDRARPVYARARRLFVRAKGYGMHGLDLSIPGFAQAFAGNDKAARARVLAAAQKEHASLLYWTAAALGSAISVSKDDMAMVGEVPKVEEMMRRGLELDEAYDEGAFHEFFITFEGSKNPATAKKHFERASQLAHNKKLGAAVSYAEGALVESQNRKEFEHLLKQVVAFDVDSDPEHRLVNVLAQRRARWLLGRTSELFAE